MVILEIKKFGKTWKESRVFRVFRDCLKMKFEKSLKTEHPEIAALWHPSLNGDLLPEEVPPRSNKKVWWTCKENHSYPRTVDKQVSSKKVICPVCAGKLFVPGINDVKTKFPEIAEEWDYEANGKKRPEDYSFISSEKVTWVCKECQNKWETIIKNRCVRGSGCEKCARKKVWEKRHANMKLGIIDPELLDEWDYELNEKGPECYPPFSNEKVYWHCKKCGYRYMAKICNKSNGRKCRCCQRKIVVPGINDLATTHPKLAEEWDYEKNGDLKPQDVLAGQNKKVYWRCPNNHSYPATLNHRSTPGRETNCPICNSGRQTSFAEQAVFFYIKKAYPDAINRYTGIFNNGMELDIYIPSIKLAIEYDGEAWHKKDKREREKRKWDICKQNGIRLLRLIEKMRPGERIQADEALSIDDGPMYEPEHLQKVIFFLLDKLGSMYLHPKVDINIYRDEFEIRKYMTVIKGSLAEKFPEIAKEWDYEANGDLTPYKIKAGSDTKVGWVCPECGNHYNASINHRTGKNPTGCPECGKRKTALSKSRAVAMLDNDTGEVLKTYESISLASRENSINSGNIGMVCNGRRKSAGGFGWKYISKKDKQN